MKHLVEQAGQADHFHIDSAGTAGWHEGKRSDDRMRQHAAKRGYKLESLARQVRASDFDTFDLILVMDRANLRDIRAFNPAGEQMHKVRLFCEFLRDRDEMEVPDPYYGGAEGFEQVLDIVENGCKHLQLHFSSQLP